MSTTEKSLYDEFLAGFRRSQKGNRWRQWHGWTVTVFMRPDFASYGWCLSDEDGPHFSEG
jgi:hypothetical protein